MRRTSDYGEGQKVKVDADVSVELWVGDRWQLRAVRVGKGIEITRHPDLNGWIDAWVMRKWCKAVAKLSEYTDSLYSTPAERATWTVDSEHECDKDEQIATLTRQLSQAKKHRQDARRAYDELAAMVFDATGNESKTVLWRHRNRYLARLRDKSEFDAEVTTPTEKCDAGWLGCVLPKGHGPTHQSADGSQWTPTSVQVS